MGIDLRLLPFDAEGEINFSHTVLSCSRRYELFDLIGEIENQVGSNVPDHFSTFVSRKDNLDSHYDDTQDTPYGEPLKYIPAKALKPFAAHDAVKDNWRNRAIWAYLNCLPDDTKVALFWH